MHDFVCCPLNFSLLILYETFRRLHHVLLLETLKYLYKIHVENQFLLSLVCFDSKYKLRNKFQLSIAKKLLVAIVTVLATKEDVIYQDVRNTAIAMEAIATCLGANGL